MKWIWNGPALSGAVREAAEELNISFGDSGLSVYGVQGETLSLSPSERGIEFTFANIPQLCRGMGLLAQTMANGGNLTAPIEETPAFSNLGVMLDVSRGAIPRVETMKAVLRKMALLGYNALMLYTEDTYPVAEQPWFGYLRGGYQKEELKELDRYAKELGIELIPCIQTLAHLDRFLHWPAARSRYLDSADVLLADSPDTDALLEEMFRSLRACYTSNRIHIGMDEAMGLGLGQHLALHGYEPPMNIMLRHLKKVCALCEKYGFAPMMWSDMFFRFLSQEGNYYDVQELPEALKDAMPQGVQPVYWDYYHEDPQFYREKLRLHHQLSAQTSFAGGGWSWLSPVTDYALCAKRSVPALDACRDTGVSEVWLTLWGDDGGEASIWSSLLTMSLYAEYDYTGVFDEAKLFSRFEGISGVPAKALADLSRFNRPGQFGNEVNEVNAAKFLLYQDPLLGIFENDLRNTGVGRGYEELSLEYAEFAGNAGEPYRRLFDFYAKLAAFLGDKAELGRTILNAYDTKDLGTLRKIADETIPRMLEQLALLRCAWRSEWMQTNRPSGFEVHDLRLGGVAARLDSARERLHDYLDGEICQIEELEMKRLDYFASRNPGQGCYFWQDAATANRL